MAAAVVGAALVVTGVLLLTRRATAMAGRPGVPVVSGLMFALTGGAVISLATITLVQSEAHQPIGVFPMPVLDIKASVEAVRPGAATPAPRPQALR